jgi:hypothetical protein
MPHTTRVDPALGRYLLATPDLVLRRAVANLRANPFPPGSRALQADVDWQVLAAQFPGHQAYIYGSTSRGLVYTYEAATQTLTIRRALVDGVVRPAPGH